MGDYWQDINGREGHHYATFRLKGDGMQALRASSHSACATIGEPHHEG